MRRGLLLARDYAYRREAFGKKLADQPLHVETLAQLEVECTAGVHLVLHLASLLGKEESGEASDDDVAVARLLTPLAKLYTAKQSVAVTSEILESFGGAGYIEDTGLPRMLRDTQVTPIWEGTTNILSLDTLRAIERDGAFEPFLADIKRRIGRVKSDELRDSVSTVDRAAQKIEQFLPAQRRRSGFCAGGGPKFCVQLGAYLHGRAAARTGRLVVADRARSARCGDRAALVSSRPDPLDRARRGSPG